METINFNVLIRILLLNIGYILYTVYFLDFFLIRTKRLWHTILVLTFCIELKNILPVFYEAGIAPYPVIAFFVSLSCISVIPILCCLFQGSMVKIGLMELISEVNYCLLMAVAILPVNYLEGRRNLMLYAAPVHILDILYIPVILLFLRAQLHALKPLQNSVRNYEPSSRILTLLILFIYPFGILSTLSTLNELEIVTRSLLLATFIAIGSTLCILFLTARYRQQTLRQHAFIHTQRELIQLHYHSVHQQIAKMELDQANIDAQMEHIMSLIRREDALPDETMIRNYIRTLHTKYEEIQSTLFCREWLTDAVLHDIHQKCRKRQIPVSFSFEQYNRGNIPEETVAEILYLALNECLQEYSETQETIRSGLHVKAAAVKNLLILEISCPLAKPDRKILRNMKKLLLPLIIPYHGELTVTGEIMISLISSPHTGLARSHP